MSQSDSDSECSEQETFDPAENMDTFTYDDRRQINESAENIKVLGAKLVPWGADLSYTPLP